jgi:hypothetical protein
MISQSPCPSSVPWGSTGRELVHLCPAVTQKCSIHKHITYDQPLMKIGDDDMLM